jgi:hypothetical protein
MLFTLFNVVFRASLTHHQQKVANLGILFPDLGK